MAESDASAPTALATADAVTSRAGGYADPAYRELQRPRRREQRYMADEAGSVGHPALFSVTGVTELGEFPRGGGYPRRFIEFAGRLLGVTDYARVLHLCAGSVRAPWTIDIRPAVRPAVVADVRFLPIRDESVQWVMADPPYAREYAEAIWGLGDVYPSPAAILREIARVLIPGGRAAFLHNVVPMLPPTLHRVATHGITTGPGYRIRALTIVERSPQGELVEAVS